MRFGMVLHTDAVVSSPRFSTVTEYLSWDHDRLDALLADVQRMVEDGELERADHTFAEFFEGLRRHIRIEEEVLFPEFEARTGVTQGPTRVMRHEHRQIEEALEAMREALDRADAAAFRAGDARLLEVLSPHNAKEERILYPTTDQHLTPEERRLLLERMR